MSSTKTFKNFLQWYEKSEMSLEQVLEGLTNIGYCPTLVFDDNGYWALNCSGMQNVRLLTEDKSLQSTVFVEAKEFQPTVREAILWFLQQCIKEKGK